MKNQQSANIGKVVKGVGGKYSVKCQDKIYECYARKKVKLFYEQVMVGDNVEFSVEQGGCTIEKILPRKNRLNRPSVSNVDEVFIVIASHPEPDLLLVDKIIVFCNKNAIPTALIVNKLDISDDAFFSRLKADYQAEVEEVFGVSTVSGEGITKLLQSVSGKTVCLAGQSAVGKTSILNSFIPGLNMETGQLSVKTERGKHTTRHNEIFAMDNGGYVVDTAGFSFFDVDDIKSSELALYFNTFCTLSAKCRYKMCTHTAEPDCEVKKCLENNTLSKNRYDRYISLFNELHEKEQKLFK